MENLERTRIFDTYGMVVENLDVAKSLVEESLSISLELRNSSYYGGDYYCKRINSTAEGYELFNNCYEYDGENEWLEEEYQQYQIIFCVNMLIDCDRVRRKILKDHEGVIFFVRRCCVIDYSDYRISRKYQYINGVDKLIREDKINKIQ